MQKHIWPVSIPAVQILLKYRDLKKFLEIWKEADPGIAEIETAKKNLAELKKSA